MAVDLKQLSPKELQALIASAKEQLESSSVQHRQTTRDRLIAMAQEAGYELGELFGFGGKIKKGKRRSGGTGSADGVHAGTASKPVKYRHPADASLIWGGLGKRPRWVHDWLASGGSLEAALAK